MCTGTHTFLPLSLSLSCPSLLPSLSTSNRANGQREREEALLKEVFQMSEEGDEEREVINLKESG